jgi:ribosomal protein L11 methyltransferase
MNDWLEIGIDTTTDALDDLSAYLMAVGIMGLVLEDEQDFTQFLEENHEYWDYVDEELMAQKRGVCRAVFYVTNDEDGLARLDEVRAGLEGFRARCPREVGTLELHQTGLREEDWANNWRNYYKPLEVGEKLYIVPEWMRQEPVPQGRTPIYLNPGLIFGTGSHASTQLCLGGLQKVVKPGDKILDLGCGSGILAIAALQLGGSTAVGCDIDPKAVKVAMENASFNGIDESRLTVYAGNVLEDDALCAQMAQGGKYQIVLANIVADVIIPLSVMVDQFLAEDGLFLCSGIIDTRAQEVREALEQNGFTILETGTKSDWYFYLAKKA